MPNMLEKYSEYDLSYIHIYIVYSTYYVVENPPYGPAIAKSSITV